MGWHNGLLHVRSIILYSFHAIIQFVKFNNLKNYIFANILSIIGYVYFLIWLYLYLIVKPNIMMWKGGNTINIDTIQMAHSSIFIDIIFSSIISCFIISFILILFNIIEFILRKKILFQI